jgi:hypothetical protein
MSRDPQEMENLIQDLIVLLNKANDYLDTGLVYAGHETILAAIGRAEEWASA